ncbi:MAG: hypothetical protein ABH950_04220 [Candidatus Altiarchaeota archaeon]
MSPQKRKTTRNAIRPEDHTGERPAAKSPQSIAAVDPGLKGAAESAPISTTKDPLQRLRDVVKWAYDQANNFTDKAHPGKVGLYTIANELEWGKEGRKKKPKPVLGKGKDYAEKHTISVPKSELPKGVESIKTKYNAYDSDGMQLEIMLDERISAEIRD